MGKERKAFGKTSISWLVASSEKRIWELRPPQGTKSIRCGSKSEKAT